MTIEPLPRGLYLVTRETDDSAALLATVAAAIEGGAVLVQYRDKSADAARRREQALALRALCREHAVPLLINDDIALAQAIEAEGVHLGEHDASIAAARRRLGRDAIIGASCYDDLARARDLAAQGANYLAFGAFFPTRTKIATRRATVEHLRGAAALGLPRVAIGGITPGNAAPLVAAGADLLAVVGALFDAADPCAVARSFSALYQESPA